LIYFAQIYAMVVLFHMTITGNQATTMKTPPKTTPKRSDDQDRITFSLPKKLKERIDLECKNDRRTRSQWLILQLEKICGVSLEVVEAEKNSKAK